MNLRRLMWMAEGAQIDAWSKLSCVLAKVHNSFVSKRRDLKTPDDFNPYATYQKQQQLLEWADSVEDENLAVGTVTF